MRHNKTRQRATIQQLTRVLDLYSVPYRLTSTGGGQVYRIYTDLSPVPIRIALTGYVNKKDLGRWLRSVPGKDFVVTALRLTLQNCTRKKPKSK